MLHPGVIGRYYMIIKRKRKKSIDPSIQSNPLITLSAAKTVERRHHRSCRHLSHFLCQVHFIPLFLSNLDLDSVFCILQLPLPPQLLLYLDRDSLTSDPDPDRTVHNSHKPPTTYPVRGGSKLTARASSGVDASLRDAQSRILAFGFALFFLLLHSP